MLSCDGAPYQFSGLRDPSLLIELSLHLYKNLIQNNFRFTPGFCHSFHHLHCDLQAKLKQENGRTSEKPDPDEENLVDVIHSLHQLFHKLCISDTGANGDPKVCQPFFSFEIVIDRIAI